jgi:hypothetical protein
VNPSGIGKLVFIEINKFQRWVVSKDAHYRQKKKNKKTCLFFFIFFLFLLSFPFPSHLFNSLLIAFPLISQTKTKKQKTKKSKG